VRDSLAVEANARVGALLDGGSTASSSEGGVIEHLGLPAGSEHQVVTTMCHR
jgi:hypothetical protein